MFCCYRLPAILISVLVLLLGACPVFASHQQVLSKPVLAPDDQSYSVKFDGTNQYNPVLISFSSSIPADPGFDLALKWTTNGGSCEDYRPTIMTVSWSDTPITSIVSDCHGALCVCHGTVNVSGQEIMMQSVQAKDTTVNASWPQITNMKSATAADSALLPKKLLGGYFTDWATYHYPLDFPYQRLYGGDQNRSVHLNTVFYQSAKIVNPATAKPGVALFDSGSDPYLMSGVAQWRYDHPQSRVLLSFGGWGDDTQGTHPSADIQSVLEAGDVVVLAHQMVDAAVADGFNGVDIDLEWWGAPGTHTLTPAEAKKFVQLFDEIRAYENQLESVFPALGPLYLSIAAPGGAQNASLLEDPQYAPSGWKRISNDVNFFDPMTYDFYVAGDDQPADHQSRYSGGVNDHFSIEGLLTYYHKVGVDSSKVSLGVPVYARSEFGVPSTGRPGSSDFSHSTDTPYSGLGGGVLSYKCLIADQLALPLIDGCASLENDFQELLPASTYHHADDPDNQAILAPWLIASDNKNNRALLSFDDVTSVDLKMQKVLQQGLSSGGGFLWELDMDVSPLDAQYYTDYSLLEAVYHRLQSV